MRKQFELHQNVKLLVNEYRVFDTNEPSPRLTGFVRQKRLTPREQFTLFADEAESQVLARAKARSALDLGAMYDVEDEAGKSLALIKKEFQRSLLRSTWTVTSPEGVVITVSEKNLLVALLRRAWELVGELPFPLRFHFQIASGGQTIGEFKKTALIRDKYALYLDEKSESLLDPRAWVIFGVLLDAMQSR